MRISDYQPGLLFHSVGIYRDDGTADDGGGGFEPSWVLVATKAANVSGAMTAREVLFAQQLRTEITQRVVLRYFPDVDFNNGTFKIVFRSREFLVQGAANVEERNRWLVLFCTEGVIT